MVLEVSARGGASVDAVWDRYTRPRHWPRWSPQVRAIEPAALADAPIGPGTRGVVRGPGGLRVAFTVTAVDPDARTWSWLVRVGPLSVPMQHGVTADPVGSRAWVKIGGPLMVALGYAPAARLALRRLVRP